MIRRRVLATAAGAALAVSCSAAPGAAQASNSSATSAYVRANYALVAAGKSHLGASIAAYKGVLAKVRRDCPRAAEGSPQNPDSTKLSNEVIGAMVLSAGVPDRPAIATYLRTVKGLQLEQRLDHPRCQELRVQPQQALRPVGARTCAATSAPGRPAATRRCRRARSRSSKSSTRTGSRSACSRPGSPASRAAARVSLAHSAARFEYQLTNAEAEAVETWGDIMNALELWP